MAIPRHKTTFDRSVFGVLGGIDGQCGQYELFTQVLAWGGAITGEHGVGIAKQRWWPQAVPEVGRSVHEALKRALDPQGLINPDKFVTVSGAG